jgi:regulator of protease activity HflC (stomatin/prohibitin superfamily)
MTTTKRRKTMTAIAIIIGIVSLIGLYLVQCILITKPGHVSLVGILGAKPERLERPGITLVFWPFELQIEMVSTERQTYNLPPTRVICTIDPISKRKLSLATNGITELIAEEVSLSYQLSFGNDPRDSTDPAEKTKAEKKQTDKMNGYFELSEDGQLAKEKIEEMLKDMIQGFLRDKSRVLGLVETIAAQDTLLDQVKKNVRLECDNLNIPIKVIDLIMNKPMKPAEERIRVALEDKSVARIERAAAEEKKNLEEYNADRDLAIKRKQAEAQKAGLRVLAELWGIDKLPETERAAYWLSREALEAYKEMARSPNTKFVLSGSVFGEIQSMLKKVAGGN